MPIIVTGNDLSTLFAPLVRDGRMAKFYWEPSRNDLQNILHQMYKVCLLAAPSAQGPTSAVCVLEKPRIALAHLLAMICAAFKCDQRLRMRPSLSTSQSSCGAQMHACQHIDTRTIRKLTRGSFR